MDNRRILSRKVLAFTLFASLCSVVLMLYLFSESFPEALYQFFAAPLANTYFFGNFLSGTIPLMVAGLGVAFAFSSRNFNLGGEGQLYAGAFASTIVALWASESGIGASGAQLLSFAAAMAAGGLLGGFSGMLKRRLGVDELISSFLVSAIVVLIVDYLVAGPFQDPASNFQSTGTLPARLAFAKILPPSALSTGLFVALAVVIAGKLLLDRTRFGFELKLCGINREFAKYSGIDAGFYTVLPMTISGALHGLAGALMIFGSYRATIRGFSAGAGWNAIAVSLIAKNNPLALIPSSLFYAYLEAGSKSVLLGSSVTAEIAAIVQSVLFLLITAGRLPFSRRAKRQGGGL